jgi:hypothetical protein
MKMSQRRLNLSATRGTTMFKTIKLWWKVRKLKKALANQVEIEKLDNRKYVAKPSSYWKKNGKVIWQ